MKKVDWNKYAQSYDNMAKHNPEYQKLLEYIKNTVRKIEPKENILDIGGGTGNISLTIAEEFPNSKITLLDISKEMISHAKEKAKRTNIKNIEFILGDGTKLPIGNDTKDLVMYVHSLYAFPTKNNKPTTAEKSLKEAYRVLKPKGKIMIIDIGREIPTEKLAKELLIHNIRKHGIIYTAKLYIQNWIVVTENKKIKESQEKGYMWTHDLNELEETVKKTGFTIKHKETGLYFGLDDIIIAKKEKS